MPFVYPDIFISVGGPKITIVARAFHILFYLRYGA